MSEWRFERVGCFPERPEDVLIIAQGDELKVRARYDALCKQWDSGWDASHGVARLVNPSGETVAERTAPPYDQTRLRLVSALEHIISRPTMYFGTVGPDGAKKDVSAVAVELAAFLNGYMAHRSGLVGGFGFGCRADPNKTLEENAEDFRAAILKWDAAKSGGAEPRDKVSSEENHGQIV